MFTKTLAKAILAAFRLPPCPDRQCLDRRGFIGLNGFFTPSTPHWLMIAILFVGGCFRSHAVHEHQCASPMRMSRNRDMSSATSLSSVAQQLSL